MKAKFIGLAVGLLAAATIGIVQLQAQAAGHPSGKVGNAPVCDANAIGKRGDTSIDLTTTNAPHLAYDVHNGVATVKFKVTGPNNCKVRLSNMSFWAPSQNGRPYDRQILHQRATRVFTPGRHTMSVRVPTQPKQGMCFYQVDLTYGTQIHSPVIAYGHGSILSCLPKPKAACKDLTVKKLSDTRFRFNASATVKNGAKVRGYTFIVSRGNQVVKTQPVQTSKLKTSFTYTAPSDGNYTVRVKVRTSVGEKSGPNCVETFRVKRDQPTPGVAINKLVEGADFLRVGTNVEFEYQIAVTNTGETRLTNVAVTDTPEEGITLISASAGTVSGNKWTHTIPALAVGQTKNFTLKAKVPVFLAGRLTNTVCVDAPGVPGNPDDCDTADVKVTEPGKVLVCDPETGNIISVPEEDEDKYLPVGSPECEDEPEVPVDEEVPTAEELPTTGPVEVIAQLLGATSLTTAGTYYAASRRKL